VRPYRIAWAAFGLTVAAGAGALVLDVLDRSAQPLLRNSLALLVPAGYAFIGALIVARQPRNAIGWLFAAVGLTLATTAGLAQSYAIYTLVVNPGALPGARLALWLQSPALDSTFLLMMSLLLLLFPDGRPLTPRWRIAVWSAAVGALLGLSQAFEPFHIDAPLESFRNPFVATGHAATLLNWAGAASTPPTLVGLLGGLLSAVLRFRRSRGVERQQLRWFAAGVVAVLGADGAVFIVAVVVLPATTCLAILRYRLYEIDVLVRRTIIYTCLFAGLVGVYVAGVAVLGTLFRLATGQSGTLAVTLSTLLVAATFQPLRSRIQRAYDAARTLDAFSGRMRQQVDLEAVSDEVLGVVRDTLHPAHATLWLRPPEVGR